VTTEELFRCADYRAMYAACLADVQNLTGWGALRDWLRDHGTPEAIVQEAEPILTLRPWDIDRFLSGSGRGSGRGSGIGRGSGSGSSGGGRGRGSGIGIGRGSGSSGGGIGSGIGSGSGSGRGIGEPYEAKQMEPGKCYLVHCGDWHTLVGRCVRQVGPMTYLFESVSKIAETNNGDCWHQLAAGDKRLRKAATYQHYTTPCPIPLTIFATEWVGELPQEV
jgi:hypothetical protein